MKGVVLFQVDPDDRHLLAKAPNTNTCQRDAVTLISGAAYTWPDWRVNADQAARSAASPWLR